MNTNNSDNKYGCFLYDDDNKWKPLCDSEEYNLSYIDNVLNLFGCIQDGSIDIDISLNALSVANEITKMIKTQGIFEMYINGKKFIGNIIRKKNFKWKKKGNKYKKYSIKSNKILFEFIGHE